MMSLLIVLTAGGVVVGSAVIARHRAQAAADLAALAAAGHLGAGPQAACGLASSVAEGMAASVSACAVSELDVVLTVEVSVRLGRLGIHVARAAARAGPGERGG